MQTVSTLAGMGGASGLAEASGTERQLDICDAVEIALPAEVDGKPPRFVHRHNFDQSHDSICTKCFRTVSGSPLESFLTQSETDHTCGDLEGRTWCTERTEVY
jgi:hypothetical protein